MRIRRCDNCGKFNPPILEGNPRLCAACATPDGFYSMGSHPLKANGKINWWRLQFPIKLRWRGWWTL